jgi:titin
MAESGAAVVWWNPAGAEGSAVLSYTVTASPGGAGCTYVVAQPESDMCTVTGLPNRTSYTFTVTATNADGMSPASSASSPVIWSTVPDAPTGVTVTAGNASVVVTWNPAGAEGSAVLSYTVTSSPGKKTCTYTVVQPENDTCTVAGLTNGKAYTFTVTATNADGTSASSAPSASATPVPAPQITSFSPGAGAVGTVVVIQGTNLSGVTKVTFGKKGPSATIKKDTATKIKVIVPAGAVSGAIFVTTPSGTAHTATKFAVQ